jgi:hypothetical protein
MSEQTKSKFLGDFGEILFAWHLRSKYGIDTAIYKGMGVDLLCRDTEGRLLPKNELVAISVKTRARGKHNILESVTSDWTKTKEAATAWNAEPYFAYVRICADDGSITFFLLAVSEAEQLGKHFNVKLFEDYAKIFTMRFDPYSDFWRIKEKSSRAV